MEYLLVMTLSGGTMMVCGWILRRLFRNRISANLYYMMAKAAVLYYLVPLPFLKSWYGKVIHAVLPEGQSETVEMEISQVSLTWTKYIVRTDGKMYVNNYMGIQMTVVLIWLAVACFLMMRELVKHVRRLRLVAGYAETKMTEEHEAFLTGFKEEYGVRRRVLLYQGERDKPTVTSGVFRLVILCGREIGSRESEFLIRHEMVHIRRLDAFWKMLIQFVKFLHWYNPMMWLLLDELDRVCEISCDETAARKLSEEERNSYMRLLIEEAQKTKEPKRLSFKWEAGFGSGMRRVKERMDNLMRKNKWNRFATGTLVAALVFANSMTAFAYRDGYNLVMTEDASQEQIEKVVDSDVGEFMSDEVEGEVLSGLEEQEMDVILYDRQFEDEEGNIYPVPETEPQWGCDHDYVSGKERLHNSNSDGSCDVTVYKAQRCSKCGTIWLGEYISSTHYAVCPH